MGSTPQEVRERREINPERMKILRKMAERKKKCHTVRMWNIF